MIEHIVMIKLKENFKNTEIANKIKTELNKLPNLINEIKHYEVGINISKSIAAYNIVLVSRFESLKTLDDYKIHPEHQKVLSLIKKHAANTAVVDFKHN